MSTIYNFSPGPAILPVPVLERVQHELLELPGSGISILEMSHRSKRFMGIAESAEQGIRRLLGLTDNYRVLFLQGGATTQFSMVPLNLMPQGGSADYVVTGIWSQKAVKEAARVGTVRIAASSEADGFRAIPRAADIEFKQDAAYAHITTNNTIVGTQWQEDPDTGSVPLVADASSDILSRPFDTARYGLIYAGAQKNVGVSGITIVIIRDDLIRPVPDTLPIMLNYKTHVKNQSLYNTPNTFGIYVIDLVCQWIESLGGLTAMQQRNEEKAALLYETIDASEFYRGYSEPASRSRMNVTFRLASEELEARFLAEAGAAGFIELKGHRDVGGIRASIYNAMPLSGVAALAEFMRDFAGRNG